MVRNLKLASKFAVLILFLIGAVSCNKSTREQMRDAEKADMALFLKKNAGFERQLAGYYLKMEEEGEGEKPVYGDKCYLYYTCTYIDGYLYYSNEEDGRFEPADLFLYGNSNGIGLNNQAIHDAVSKMKKGGKVRVLVPSSFLMGISLPSYTPLVYELEMVDIRKP